MQSRYRLVFASALFCVGSSACDSGGGGVAAVPLPPTTACTLTAIAQEVAYVESSGAGSVQVVLDPSSPDHFAYIINGQRYVVVPSSAALLPPEVRDFFLFHEFGHHFAGHHQRYGALSCKVAEYEADAFATRVLYAESGALALSSVTSWFATFGNQGDPTHRTKTERVLYIEQVLAAAETQGAPCPEVPATDCVNQPMGSLWLLNTKPEAIQVYANGQLLGLVGSGMKGNFMLPIGPVLLEFWGTIFYPFQGYVYYGQGTYPIYIGEITSL